MSIYDGTDFAFAPHENPRHRRKFILCFDGTGNKFTGTDSDSNILKIYRMLDRSDHTCITYYQPGIGTYAGTTLSHTSHLARLKSWYLKTKDMALGSSLDEHVIGGYKFLMRYYRPGDEIYMFGFSRGAYTARFLAEMIDHVGLLSQGNEELIRFAWKTFQKWQMRKAKTAKDQEEKKYLLKYMLAFRETFSRPVDPIKFLGLFDTVNSVSMFENAIMSRTKFPYTASTTAKVIRHAVSIGERRAKFRQDLIAEKKPHRPAHYRPEFKKPDPMVSAKVPDINVPELQENDRGRESTLKVPQFPHTQKPRDTSEIARDRSQGPDHSGFSDSASYTSWQALHLDDEETEQDIQEVWFLGDHADIGGGWGLKDEKDIPLAHIPLVWIVREAQRAGLRFDPTKLRALQCAPEEYHEKSKYKVPVIVEPQEQEKLENAEAGPSTNGNKLANDSVPIDELPEFHRKLHVAATKGTIHDMLSLDKAKNYGFGAWIWWSFMEHLPLRRMDLQPDGSWKPISWPLPMGEVRDIPDNVVIHNSVLRRMMADARCRPGNLIVGGGGRGVLVAPEEYGIGTWKVLREEGDIVGEVYVRDGKPPGSRHYSKSIEKTKEDNMTNGENHED